MADLSKEARKRVKDEMMEEEAAPSKRRSGMAEPVPGSGEDQEGAGQPLGHDQMGEVQGHDQWRKDQGQDQWGEDQGQDQGGEDQGQDQWAEDQGQDQWSEGQWGDQWVKEEWDEKDWKGDGWSKVEEGGWDRGEC